MAAGQDSRIVVHTTDGFPFRDLKYNATNKVDWVVLLDGAAATISGTPTLTLHGSTDVAPTCTVASNIVTAEITSADFTTLGKTPGATILAQLSGVVTDGSDSHTFDHEEIMVVVRSKLQPTMPLTDVTQYYPELASANSLPSGQTTWDFARRIGYRDLRSWLAMQGPARHAALIENREILRPIERAYALLTISRIQASLKGQNTVWADRITVHEQEVDRLQQSLLAWFEATQPTSLSDEPERIQQTLQRQKTWMGRANGYGGGRL